MAGKTRRVNKEKNIKKILLIALIALVVVAAILVTIFLLNGEQELSREEILATGTYFEGVSVEGVDLSGMTLEEAKPLIEEKAAYLEEQTTINYRVGTETYSLTGQEMGLTVDYEPTLEEALLYGREGDASERTALINQAKEEGVDFPLTLSVNRTVLDTTLSQKSAQYDIQPVDAKVEVVKEEDEDSLYINGEIVFTPEVMGSVVDAAKLGDDIETAIANRETETVLETVSNEVAPEVTEEVLRENCVLRNSYTTTFKTSKEGRRYNVWKMGTVVNGIVVQPGETWSINDAAGPRTNENGWKNAAGIANGAYVDEPGGGICQTSSTLYIALIKSEVEITDRSHHSWPLEYVPAGLDATISTGSPDFKFTNNFDTPITVLVKCDGEDERYITVEVYGPPMDYNVRFETEIVGDEEPGPAETVIDEDMKPGTSEWTKPRHNKITVDVYKIIEDKETQEIISREKFYTDVYRAFPGQITMGPTVTPTPTPTPTPTETETVAPTETVEPTETVKPTESQETETPLPTETTQEE